MKAKELRIGNWVRINNANEHIVDVMCDSVNTCNHEGMTLDLVEPIPLSHELLEKCGFEKETKPSSIIGITAFDVYKLDVFTYNTSHGHFWIGGKYGYFKEPKYLHQLQNLYHALTGHELEVKV